MAKDWNDVSNEDILNYDGASTAEIARLERILSHRNTVALLDVRASLFDLKKSVHINTDKIVDVVSRVSTSLDGLAEQQRLMLKSQERSQMIGWALTFVIAAATVAYTFITYQSVQAQREAVSIQRDIASDQGSVE